MCGIFGLLNSDRSRIFINKYFEKGNARSRFSKLINYKNLYFVSRLAINGLNTESNRPFILKIQF